MRAPRLPRRAPPAAGPQPTRVVPAADAGAARLAPPPPQRVHPRVLPSGRRRSLRGGAPHLPGHPARAADGAARAGGRDSPRPQTARGWRRCRSLGPAAARRTSRARPPGSNTATLQRSRLARTRRSLRGTAHTPRTSAGGACVQRCEPRIVVHGEHHHDALPERLEQLARRCSGAADRRHGANHFPTVHVRHAGLKPNRVAIQIVGARDDRAGAVLGSRGLEAHLVRAGGQRGRSGDVDDARHREPLRDPVGGHAPEWRESGVARCILERHHQHAPCDRQVRCTRGIVR